MSDEPVLEQRPAQPYVGLRVTTTMAGLPATVDRGWPQVFGSIGEQALALAGAPFIRYLEVDMDNELVLDLGVPVTEENLTVNRGLHVDELPAGRWVSLRHVGPYDGLIGANGRVQEWVGEQGLDFDIDGQLWRGRVEHYVSDPREVPATECITFVDYLVRGT